MGPSGSRVAVRVAQAEDAAVLERIEAVSFDGDRLSRRSINHHLQSPTCDAFVAELAGRIVGYSMLFYRRNSRIARLYSIATVPEARGHGVAGALMAAGEKAAARRGADTLRLEVRVDNDAAIGLYHRLGYHDFGRHEDYYEDGQAALRLEKALSGSKVAAA
ncbi:MAG: GNAT family N-acetyltransferase [Alphaproteobacteria bacterium]|nr:GNAT family N-acetyltransferase [Alphaproteobacteria bacterium]